jgi:hypothetical protein
MKSRCSNPKHQWYPYYGGRGISVCDEWMEFVPFMNWALANGYADNLTIERTDNDGNYTPTNCKWATQHEQSMNKGHLRSKTGYVGVRKHKNGGFVAEVIRHRKYYYVGHFATVEQANIARIKFLEGCCD